MFPVTPAQSRGEKTKDRGTEFKYYLGTLLTITCVDNEGTIRTGQDDFVELLFYKLGTQTFQGRTGFSKNAGSQD